MTLKFAELTLCLVNTSELLEAGVVSDVDDEGKLEPKPFTEWKQVTTIPDGLKIYGLMRSTLGVYALPVINAWADTHGKKMENTTFG